MTDNNIMPIGVARIIYKEIVIGDRKKFKARSNNAKTGGGARDLRFRPYEKFGPVFDRMLPVKNKRGVCIGNFNWMEDENLISKEAYFHPPTPSRKNEGRIANIDKYLPGDRIPPAGVNRVILLFIQRLDGTVWPSFTADRNYIINGQDCSLKSGIWDSRVSEAIMEGLSAKRGARVAASGFMDFETGEVYCNGK